MAGTRAQKYKPEIVEQLRRKLASLPERMPEELTRTQVIRGLSKQVGELRKRGYSMRAIAEVISGEGVTITTGTLQRCLGRSKTEQRRSNRRHFRGGARDSTESGAINLPAVNRERPGNGEVGSVGTARARIDHASELGRCMPLSNGKIERSEPDQRESNRRHSSGKAGNSAGNSAGISPAMIRKQPDDHSVNSVDTAANHLDDTDENRVEAEGGSNRKIDWARPIAGRANSGSSAGSGHRVTRVDGEKRTAVVPREDTPDI